MNKTAYLSGPMRGFEQWNFPAFDRNAKFLRDQGWNIISPAEVDRSLGFDETDPNAVFTDADFQRAIRRDYAALLECDSIIFMPGWEKSTGAILESNFANVLKLDRYRVDADKNYFEKELILGLTGFARSGKDSIAQEFVQNDGFQRIGFADSLKKVLYALNPIVGKGWRDGGWVSNDRVQENVDIFGWENVKSVKEIRELLQRLGTEGGRQALGEDIWVKTLFNSPTQARIIIPDVRFANEAAEIQRRGGKVIRVMRPGVGPANDHASEQIDFDVDFTVQNDRTPKEAYLDVKEFLMHQGEFLLSSETGLPSYSLV